MTDTDQTPREWETGELLHVLKSLRHYKGGCACSLCRKESAALTEAIRRLEGEERREWRDAALQARSDLEDIAEEILPDGLTWAAWSTPANTIRWINELEANPDPQPTEPDEGERAYPCDRCGKMRSKAEGGTVFTVCEDCWDAGWVGGDTPTEHPAVEHLYHAMFYVGDAFAAETAEFANKASEKAREEVARAVEALTDD